MCGAVKGCNGATPFPLRTKEGKNAPLPENCFGIGDVLLSGKPTCLRKKIVKKTRWNQCGIKEEKIAPKGTPYTRQNGKHAGHGSPEIRVLKKREIEYYLAKQKTPSSWQRRSSNVHLRLKAKAECGDRWKNRGPA